MIVLNDRWRVIEAPYDPPQWLLQRRDGTWRSLSFCQTRDGLLTAINEKVINASRFYPGATSMPVAASALDAVRNLPERAQERQT